MLAVRGPDSEGLVRHIPRDELDESLVVQPSGCVAEVCQQTTKLVRISSSSPKEKRVG